jgi:hypothetical protein
MTPSESFREAHPVTAIMFVFLLKFGWWSNMFPHQHLHIHESRYLKRMDVLFPYLLRVFVSGYQPDFPLFHAVSPNQGRSQLRSRLWLSLLRRAKINTNTQKVSKNPTGNLYVSCSRFVFCFLPSPYPLATEVVTVGSETVATAVRWPQS